MPSHERARRISASPPPPLRFASVSSMRSSSQSPSRRFATAVSALPTCSEPVGLGANRTRFTCRAYSGVQLEHLAREHVRARVERAAVAVVHQLRQLLGRIVPARLEPRDADAELR